ncbi:MAG: hypothetical protein WC251_05795 [Candidatus Izemoplasmatales bacterium]
MDLARMKEFVEKQKQKSRLEVIRSWFSSFAVTAVAVVAVVVIVPKSPEAAFTSVEPFANEVVYQLQVTDEDSSIIDGTLKLVVENQMEHYEKTLATGFNSGIVENLRANTKYDVTIYADKGFGLENLASQSIKTLSRAGGAIIGETLLSDPNESSLIYTIDYLWHDPETEYKETRLIYGYMYPGGEEIYNLTTIVLTPGETSTIIENIPNYNVKVVINFEATNQADQIVAIDEFSFQTPLDVSVYTYLSQVTNKSVIMTVYPESSVISDASYKATLYLGSRKIQEQQIVSSESSHDPHSYDLEVEFLGLRAETEYTVIIEATFTHPYTLETITKIVGSISFQTLGAFTHSVDIEITETEYLVTVTLTDPAHNFQKGFYELIVIENGEEMYYGGSETSFVPSGEQKTTEIIIAIPTYAQYRIEIGVRNQTEYEKYVVLETIKP